MLQLKKLDHDTSTTRLVKKVEAMFNNMPDSIPVFNHYTPAAWLIRNPNVLTGKSEAIQRTLSVAEQIFKTFNRLIE